MLSIPVATINEFSSITTGIRASPHVLDEALKIARKLLSCEWQSFFFFVAIMNKSLAYTTLKPKSFLPMINDIKTTLVSCVNSEIGRASFAIINNKRI